MRPDPRLEDELTWYYQCSESAMGIRSNYGAMVAALAMFGGKAAESRPASVAVRYRRRSRGAVEYDDSVLEAAHRANRVARALAWIGDHAATLREVYGEPHPWADTWGRVAPLVHRTAAARDAYRAASPRRAYHEWLARLGRRGRVLQAKGVREDPLADRKRYSAANLYMSILLEAEAMLGSACEAFAGAAKRRADT